MRKEAKIFQTDRGLEIEVEGQTIATLLVSMPAEPQTTEEPQPENNEEQPATPAEPEEPKSITYTFDETFSPDITASRNVEPSKMWAVPHTLSEGGNTVHMPANAFVRDGVLNLVIKQETAKYGNTVCDGTTGYLYSQKVFGLGRVDVEACLDYSRDIKNSIWLTTAGYIDKTLTLFPDFEVQIECDVVEYTGADTGEYNTSRGMWKWNSHKAVIAGQTLPRIDLETKQSISGGSWWWTSNGWYQWTLYPICRNGNRLKGTNGKYYFITNKERGVALSSNDLTWIREDGVEGQGLDGNRYFIAAQTDALGKGANKTQFLDGQTKIAGWHKWSIVMDNDYIAYLCDDQEYWRSPEPLELPDDLRYNLIFATNHVKGANYTGEHTMLVKSVTYTPKTPELSEIEPLDKDIL